MRGVRPKCAFTLSAVPLVGSGPCLRLCKATARSDFDEGSGRHFSYDSQTTVRRGQTAYRLDGRHLMEVQLCTQSPAVDRRLFAHPDDAVVETFVHLIREELRK